MKYLAFIAVLLLAACQSKNKPSNQSSAAEKEEIMFPLADTAIFNWRGIEKQTLSRATFVKKAADILKYEYEIYGMYGHNYSQFDEAIHVIDINNDGKDDIIYTGSTGGEGYEMVILLNTPSGFKSVLKQMQLVRKIEFKNNRLFRIYIQDIGCCADWLFFNRVYQVDYEGTKPKFNTIYLTAHIGGCYLPKTYFKKPIYFEVLNNDYKMRLKPIINDVNDGKSGFGGNMMIGNNIDTLEKGTKGRAIAEQTDKTGRVWWLVELNPKRTYGDLFYEQATDTTTTSGKIGWISSRYVKKIPAQTFQYSNKK